MARDRRILLSLALPALLAGCHSGDDQQRNLDSLDKELSNSASPGNSRDTALTSALHDQIMVDPALAQQANGNAVRPPAQPYSAQIPPDQTASADADQAAAASGVSQAVRAAPAANKDCPDCATTKKAMTLGALAAMQKDKRTSACAANVQYSARWANRLPRDLPLYPGAHVTEAAGTQNADCALRVVSFSSGTPMKKLIDWYYTRVTNAGYSADHQTDGAQHVLGGTRKRDDAAYILFMTKRGDGGTDVDLVANTGS